MDFREINTFIHVANQESFSKAADVLGYTQAAVSIQIKQLESELGTRLFDRIGKHISLTHQGKVFYQYALRITSEIEEAKDVRNLFTLRTSRRMCKRRKMGEQS